MKFREPLVLVTGSILLSSISCSGGGTDSPGISERVEDTILSPADSSIIVSDTLSADLMEDFEIVTVDDIDANEEGYIAILDGAKAMVTLLDPSGEFIAYAGGSGSGPGEFQSPLTLSISEDRYVAVSDLMAGTVRILEPSLDSYHDIPGFMMANPGVMHLINASGFSGMRLVFRAEDGNTMIGYQIALWDESTSEPTLIFKEDLEPFTPNDFGRSAVTPYPMTATADGNVLTAEVSTEEYIVYCFEPDGGLLWAAEYPLERVKKSELEIQIEEDMAERRMQQSAHQVDYTADPFHYSVSSMGIGPSGGLWVRRPGGEGAFFDVIDPEDGFLLFTASLPESIALSRIEITRAGIFGVTEGEIQSLIELGIQAP